VGVLAHHLTLKRSKDGGRVHPPYRFGIPAQLDVPPLTLSRSPEYKGEEISTGLRTDQGDTPRLWKFMEHLGSRTRSGVIESGNTS
jgi:hypothetical protein